MHTAHIISALLRQWYITYGTSWENLPYNHESFSSSSHDLYVCSFIDILRRCEILATIGVYEVNYTCYVCFVTQLGEILFVDLKLKMAAASVEVKESITSMELMQDKQHETTAILVNNIILSSGRSWVETCKALLSPTPVSVLFL